MTPTPWVAEVLLTTEESGQVALRGSRSFLNNVVREQRIF